MFGSCNKELHKFYIPFNPFKPLHPFSGFTPKIDKQVRKEGCLQSQRGSSTPFDARPSWSFFIAHNSMLPILMITRLTYLTTTFNILFQISNYQFGNEIPCWCLWLIYFYWFWGGLINNTIYKIKWSSIINDRYFGVTTLLVCTLLLTSSKQLTSLRCLLWTFLWLRC